MILVIGGCAQGKLELVMQGRNADDCIVFDGEIPKGGIVPKKTVIINHFHNWVRKELIRGENAEKNAEAFLEKYKDCIIISDEIGNGIIPADIFEREYRERTGRLLTNIAARADEVVRILCGICRKIK